MNVPPLGVGDRVYITSKGHPWYGYTGTILRSFEVHPDLDWVVRLEADDAMDGHECAVAARHLRHESRERR